MKSGYIKYSMVSILALVITYGCNPRIVPLTGQFRNSAFEMISEKSIDSVWTGLTHLLTSNGLPVKSIQRTEGIILTKKAPFNSIYTFEDNNGKLLQPDAWVVIEKTYVKNRQWKPKEIFGKWNILVTDAGDGRSRIKVDPVVVCTYYPNSFTAVETRCPSTGKLEELINRLFGKF